MTYKKKLIEVALPLTAINRASAAEKFIHVGTTSNLHAWRARRPLAACRAVKFVSLVDDPGEYLLEEAAAVKRAELFRLIERLVEWQSNDDESVLEAARNEIRRSCQGLDLPTVVDPFCGSGTIPLEALRLGLDAIGNDVNPIAVAISKALVEVPHVVSGHQPIAPKTGQLRTTFVGFEGFRFDLSYYSNLLAKRARGAVSVLHERSYAGSIASTAWLWCRTAECPNPGCNVTIPLHSSFWLSKTRKSRAFLRIRDLAPSDDDKRIAFDVVTGDAEMAETPILNDTGAVCPRCSTPVPFASLRDQGRAGKIGFQMNAYVTKEGSSMTFHAATAEDEMRALSAESSTGAPETRLPDAALGFRVQNYGLQFHRDRRGGDAHDAGARAGRAVAGVVRTSRDVSDHPPGVDRDVPGCLKSAGGAASSRPPARRDPRRGTATGPARPVR